MTLTIKPLNFFSNGEIVKICDYGGSRSLTGDFGQPMTSIDEHDLSTTPQYSNFDYVMAMRNYEKNGDSENWMKAGQALDTRAMGYSLYELMTGNFPPSPKSKDMSLYPEMEKDLVNKGVNPRAAEIIVKMSRPADFDLNNPPNPFPLPVTDEELVELRQILS